MSNNYDHLRIISKTFAVKYFCQGLLENHAISRISTAIVQKKQSGMITVKDIGKHTSSEEMTTSNYTEFILFEDDIVISTNEKCFI